MIKVQSSLSAQYESLKSFLRHLKSQSIRHRDNTRDIKTTIDELLPLLKEADSRLSSVSPALVAYAKDQEDDQSYDLALEVAVLSAALQSSINWIVSNVPSDPVTGTVNERVLNVDGSVSLAVVDDMKAAEAVSKIQTVINAIG